MSTITLPQLAWHGTKELKLSLPASWPVEFYDMAGGNRTAMKPDEIRTAITNLIGAPPIRELARGKDEVAIIFDDMTRSTRVAEIVPVVLEELAQAGIADSKIRFICGLGNHGALNRLDFIKKLGQEAVDRCAVYNHNTFGNCTYVGTTGYGTELHINAEFIKCDLKIAIGSVVPHPITGFGGGGKLILPGVSSIETAQAFHRLPARAWQEKWTQNAIGMGVPDNNPSRYDVEEAATLAGLDVKIDCLVNTWGETTAIYAGALKPAYAAALNEAAAHYRTQKTQGESVVIANTFAKANEAILVGLGTAFNALGPEGGDIVLIANAPDGQVTHYLMGWFGQTEGGAMGVRARIPQQVNHVIIYSEYPDVAGRGYIEKSDKVLFMNDWDDVVRTLQEFQGDKARVAVYPAADIQYLSG